MRRQQCALTIFLVAIVVTTTGYVAAAQPPWSLAVAGNSYCLDFQRRVLQNAVPFAAADDPCWQTQYTQQKQCCFIYMPAAQSSATVTWLIKNAASGQPIAPGSVVGFDMNGIAAWLYRNQSGIVINQPWNPCTRAIAGYDDPGCQRGVASGCCSTSLTIAAAGNGGCAAGACLPCGANQQPVSSGQLNLPDGTVASISICAARPAPPPVCHAHEDCAGIGCAGNNDGGTKPYCCCNFAAGTTQSTCQRQAVPCNCIHGGPYTYCGQARPSSGAAPQDCITKCCGDTWLAYDALCTAGCCTGPNDPQPNVCMPDCAVNWVCARNYNRAPISRGQINVPTDTIAPNDNACQMTCNKQSAGQCTQCGCQCQCSCFAPGTAVHISPHQTRPIETLLAGDVVWCPTQQRPTRVAFILKVPTTQRTVYSIELSRHGPEATTARTTVTMTDGHVIYGMRDVRFAITPSTHSEPIYNVSREAIQSLRPGYQHQVATMTPTGAGIARIEPMWVSSITPVHHAHGNLYSIVLEDCHAHTANGVVVSDMFPDLGARPRVTEIAYDVWQRLAQRYARFADISREQHDAWIRRLRASIDDDETLETNVDQTQ